MKVTPEVIDPNVGAVISHSGTSTITVTIVGNGGATETTIQVPPGEGVVWMPPAGWTSATFNSPGHEEVFRLIE